MTKTDGRVTNDEWVNLLLDQSEHEPDGLARSMVVATALEVHAGVHDNSSLRPLAITPDKH